ncbi:MAG: hypothetical protein C7B47_00415 [Sulfobacillus thermosulfidooxidans]|uniref:Uncharacterized protein n=1 Tax=Sulfobacillus thermosulfidooxidans TaxID=28034 RepID=A0A2T2X5T1_SULTH|nr:MAG: hypothetical protein C7B47_00415 [Sulfobacillus thermosulfidooxidans]
MMALVEAHPTVLLVNNLLERNQVSPIFIESLSDAHSMQWMFAPQPVKKCWRCIKVDIWEQSDTRSVRIRLDKGLGRQARSYNVPHSFIMYDVWPYMRVTGVSARLKDITQAAQKVPLHLWLQVTNGVVPGFNPLSSPFHHQFHWILNEQGQLTLADPVYDVSEVGELQQVTLIYDLVARLQSLREWPWYWVSLSWGIVQDNITESNVFALLEPVMDLWQ